MQHSDSQADQSRSVESRVREDCAKRLLLIDDQVDSLRDQNFPRRRGRKTGTLELVAHPNYVVIVAQTKTVVTALAIMHVARQYP